MGKRPEHFGEHKDLYNEDMRTFVRDYFGYNDQDILWLSEVDSDRIKQIIAAGYPLIMAVSGEKLEIRFIPIRAIICWLCGDTLIIKLLRMTTAQNEEKYPYDWNVFSLQIKQLEVVHSVITTNRNPLDFCKNFYKED